METVIPFVIPKSRRELIRYQVDEQLRFYDRLHRHKEVQLSWIVRGEGSLVAGDYVGTYREGDVFLLGEDMPHVFRSRQQDGLFSRMETLFFDLELLRQSRDIYGEMDTVMLMEGPLRGVFQMENPAHWHREIGKWKELKGLKKLAFAFNTLDQLWESGHAVPLHRDLSWESDAWASSPRMEQVMHYALDNFSRDISLDEVAGLVHLTKEAFCRFFKQHTRKTFIQFLQEVRINHALQLMKYEQRSISEAAFASGFNNLSYFNRVFKRLYGQSPSALLS